MALIQIPCSNNDVDQRFQVELEGVIYTFKITWNERAQYWVMHIAKEDDTEIINGIPLLLGSDLLSRFRTNKDLPPGKFGFIDTTGANKEATVNDLNDRCLLIYVESGSSFLQ